VLAHLSAGGEHSLPGQDFGGGRLAGTGAAFPAETQISLSFPTEPTRGSKSNEGDA